MACDMPESDAMLVTQQVMHLHAVSVVTLQWTVLQELPAYLTGQGRPIIGMMPVMISLGLQQCQFPPSSQVCKHQLETLDTLGPDLRHSRLRCGTP